MSPLAWGVLTALLVLATGVATGPRQLRRGGAATRRRVLVLASSGARGDRRVPGLPPAVAAVVDRAMVPGDPIQLARAWAATLVLAPAVGVYVGGPVTALLAAMSVVMAPVVVARVRDARRVALADRSLPAFLDAVGRALRAGASLRHAVRGAGDAVSSTPLGPGAAQLAVALDGGTPLVDALMAFAGPTPSPVRRLTVDALALAADVGGAPAALVDRVAETARERAAVIREARALATQARASALVIVAAPAAFALLVIAADPRIAAFAATPVGVGCVVAGLLCDAAGAWWMARLVGRVG